MGAAFVSQQFLQNVLDYSTLEAGAAFLPTIVFMVLVAPRSAKLVETRGARFTLLCGYVSLLLAFATMLLLWDAGHRRTGRSASPTRSSGSASGFAGTPASHSLTGSVPVRRAGHGVRHRRPAARPRRRDHAVDLRRAADRRLRGRRRRRDRRRAEQRADQRRRREPAHEVVRRRGGRRAAVPAVREPDHGRGPAGLPRRRPVGVHGRHRRGRARRGARVLHVPEEGRGATGARRLPGRGLRSSPRPGDDSTREPRGRCRYEHGSQTAPARGRVQRSGAPTSSSSSASAATWRG